MIDMCVIQAVPRAVVRRYMASLELRIQGLKQNLFRFDWRAVDQIPCVEKQVNILIEDRIKELEEEFVILQQWDMENPV